ncbi:MAG: hypothetical protein L0Y58_22095 [Verrucomicrobia subdivision 3 bacterium]|nr:hypothetical protein [Limisphaerales bacterium]
MNRRRCILIFAVSSVAVLAMILFLLDRQRGASGRTADGRVVTITKVTYGLEHRFTESPLWVRMLRPVLGKAWAVRRGYYEVKLTNATPALVVWTHWDGIQGTNQISQEATLCDSRGTESEITVGRWNTRWTRYVPTKGGLSPQNQAYVAWLFRNYPRRSDRLRLRIYDRDKRYVITHAVELVFDNPTPQKFPVWRGEPLPTTITNVGFEFALRNLQRISNALWQADFAVHANGQVDYGWQIGRIEVTDATGNSVTARSNVMAVPATNLTFRLNAALWPEEYARKVKVEFCRIGDFRTNELRELLGLSVPAAWAPYQFRTNIGLRAHEFVEVSLQKTPRNIPPYVRGFPYRVNMQYALRNANDHRLILLRATDPLEPTVTSPWQSEPKIEPGYVSPDGMHTVGLLFRHDPQALDLTFGVRKNYWIEFLVESGSRSTR